LFQWNSYTFRNTSEALLNSCYRYIAVTNNQLIKEQSFHNTRTLFLRWILTIWNEYFLRGVYSSIFTLTYLSTSSKIPSNKIANNIGINAKYTKLFVWRDSINMKVINPPPKAPLNPPILLFTCLFFTRSLEEHIWQAIELWLLRKNILRNWSLLPHFGQSTKRFP